MLQHLMKRGGEDGLSDALAVCHVIGGKEEHEVEEIYLEHLVVEKEDTREAINFLRKAFSKNMEKGRGFARHLVSMAEIPVFQSDASVAIHQCGSGASLTSWATSAPAPPPPAGLADNTLALLHSLSVLCLFSKEGFWIFAFKIWAGKTCSRGGT